MGIDPHNLALLAHAADLGATFDRTLGVGRQALFVDAPDEARFRALRGLPVLAEPARGSGAPRYFEPLMRQWFAAGVVDAVDASPYEAASIVHDMNRPVDETMARLGSYDAVLDFGCLEHVFNFPVAWKNCVDLCRIGGHLLHAVPANNLLGHGFYQFSPELFFNLYRAENGFAVKGVWLAMKADPRHWWQVTDPRLARRRVTLCNAHETYLLVIAEKLRGDAVVATPQQSDYAEQAWQGTTAAEAGVDGTRPAAALSSASTSTSIPRDRRVAVKAWLASTGLLDAARSARERWRAVRTSGFTPVGPDYRRVVLDELLRRPAT